MANFRNQKRRDFTEQEPANLDSYLSVRVVEEDTKIKISFIIATSNLEENAYKIAHQIRRLNDQVVLDCYLKEGSLKSKLRKAHKNNSDYAIIVGEEELENNTVIIKSLQDESTNQKVMPVDQLDSFFQDL